MKKILFILIMFVLAGSAFGQAKKISALTEDATLSGNEYFPTIEGGNNYKMKIRTVLDNVYTSVDSARSELADTAAALRTEIGNIGAGEYFNYVETRGIPASYTIYSKYGLKYPGLWLGSNPGTAYNKYMLYVDGLSAFTDTIYAGNGIQLGENTFIYDSLGTIYLTNSTIKYDLSGLTALPTSLTEDWTLSTGAYDLNFTDASGNGYLYDVSEKRLTLKADDILLDADYVEADSIYADSVGFQKITTDNICLNDECIDDWSDVGGSGGTGIGTYYAGSASRKDTVWMPVVIEENPAFNGADSVDYIAVVTDTLATDEYLRTIAITAANINNGDTLELVPAPGAGYSIFPTEILIYLTGNTAVTGSDNSNILTGTSAMHALTVGNIGLNQTYQTWAYNSIYTAHGLGNTSPEDKAISLAFDADYTGTNRAGWIKIWYKIIEH